jgi:hypothetical protein
MKVTLARALKERARIAGKLARNFAIINRENSDLKGNVREFDLRALFAENMELHRKIIQIKQIIAQANVNIVNKMVEMAELKSLIAKLRDINTSAGIKIRNTYNGEVREVWEVVFSTSELTNMANELEKKVEQLQDEIDEFNALNKVNIPDP